MTVKRFVLDVAGEGWEFGDAYPVAVEHPDGEYVTFKDYDALAARLAEAEELLREARKQLGWYWAQCLYDGYSPLEDRLSVNMKDIDAFLTPDSAPAATCAWCVGSGRCINGEIWSWRADGPVKEKCGCVCHTTSDQPGEAGK